MDCTQWIATDHRLTRGHSSTHSLKWFSIEFNLKSCIFNCDQVSNKIAEIVGNAYKGDHNNYFAAESLHMGDEKAWLHEAKREADRCQG